VSDLEEGNLIRAMAESHAELVDLISQLLEDAIFIQLSNRPGVTGNMQISFFLDFHLFLYFVFRLAFLYRSA